MSLNIAAQCSLNVKLVTKAYNERKQEDEQVQVPSAPILQRTLPKLGWTLTESARLVFHPMAQTILLTQPPEWLCLQPCSLLARFQTSPMAAATSQQEREASLTGLSFHCPHGTVVLSIYRSVFSQDPHSVFLQTGSILQKEPSDSRRLPLTGLHPVLLKLNGK